MVPRICFHRCISHCLTLLLLFLCIAPGVLAQSQDHVIVEGDQLQITVWGYPEFTTSATVRDDGTLSIPLVGDVSAAGLRREEFAGALRQVLSDYIQGEVRVTVSVSSSTGNRVAVLGYVVRPDNYPVSNEIGLLELITAAGGFAENANMNRIKLFRKDRLQPATEIDLEYFMEHAGLNQLPTVKAGDVVFVPRQRNFVKDVGEYLGYVALFFALFRLTEGGS